MRSMQGAHEATAAIQSMQAMRTGVSVPTVPTCANMPNVPTAPDPSRLVSTTQAAKALGISQSTLSRWTKAGHVKPAQRTIGGHMRWDLDALREEVRKLTEDQG